MAATDLSAVSPADHGAARRVTLEASSGNAREVILPTWARGLLIVVTDSSGVASDDGLIAMTGTDGSAIGSDAYPVPLGGLTLPLGNRGGSLFFAGPAAGYARLILTPGW